MRISLPIYFTQKRQVLIFLPALIVCLLLRKSLFSQGESPVPVIEAKPLIFSGQADNTGSFGWPSLESRNFKVYYAPEVDLKAVQRRLNRRMFYSEGRLIPDPLLSSPEEKISFRLDILLSRVKEILDMRPRMGIITIKIFKNRQELEDEYYNVFKVRRQAKSFYVHRHETIYVSEQDISDSVIAHEMGHAVVDHYFSVIPPEKIGEMLASYVDLHLDR